MGSLADLRRLARSAVLPRAPMALLNPIHANIPGGEQPSPYYPSSRCFRTRFLLPVSSTARRRRGRPSRPDRRRAGAVRRPPVHRASSATASWPPPSGSWSSGCRAPTPPREYREAGGEALAGSPSACCPRTWRGPWPRGPTRTVTPAARRWPVSPPSTAHRAGSTSGSSGGRPPGGRRRGVGLELMHDLAIGCDPAGADAWLWRDAFARNSGGRAPGRLQQAGTGLGTPAVRPVEAPGPRLRAVHADRSGGCRAAAGFASTT